MNPHPALLVLDPSWEQNEVSRFFGKDCVQLPDTEFFVASVKVVIDADHGLVVHPSRNKGVEVYIPRAYVDAIVWMKDPEKLRAKVGFRGPE